MGQLDTHYTVNTPEGITLHLSPAGPAVRLLAWLFDLLIRLGINLLIFIILLFAGKTGMGIALLITFLLEWFYPVFFEIFKNGQTPGKKLFNIYVAQDDATPVTVSSSIIRNLLRIIDFLPALYGFGLVSMLLNRRFQRLGDLVANTVVLHKTNIPLPQDISYQPQHNKVFTQTIIQPPMTFTLKEQQSIISYHQRSEQLGQARLVELAKFTGSLVKDKSNPVTYLLGIANWLMGKR